MTAIQLFTLFSFVVAILGMIGWTCGIYRDSKK